MSACHPQSAPAADPFVSGSDAGHSLFTPDEVREFRRLAKEHAGADLTDTEARDLASRLLRSLVIVRDVQRKLAEPAQPKLDLREVTLHLRKLQHELELSAKHPSSWRWAILALHDALRIVLAFHAGDTLALLPTFDRLAKERPELPQVRSSVELLEKLRTKFMTLGVLRWPVSQERLRGAVSDGLRLIGRLEPGTSTDIRDVEGVLQELA